MVAVVVMSNAGQVLQPAGIDIGSIFTSNFSKANVESAPPVQADILGDPSETAS
jgi:hypothetical protein